MNNQEKIIKELAYYFSKTLPEGEWDFFEFGNVIDNPQPQIFYFDKVSGQGGSYYSLNPKENSKFQDELRKKINISDVYEIIYTNNAPIGSGGDEVWNTFRFKLFKDGSYEGKFFWDDTRILKIMENNIKTFPDRVIQELQFDIWNDENWETAEVILTVFDEKISCIINYFSNEKFINSKDLPLNENLYDYAKYVFSESNYGILKDKFQPWNKFIISVFHDNYYFKNEYVKYEVV